MRADARILSEWWVGVLHEVHEVVVEPGACLGCALRGVLVAAEDVEPGCARAGRAIRLSGRLDPEISVDSAGRIGSGTLAQPRALDVAPGAPLMTDSTSSV